ncbi:MAG: type I DNA topoisomerase [Rickettsiales bacterium]|jgi:DNA topoisomerase-1|nr:type I DNA topoisomerase [Rickettsiales bacterium]
MNNLVVVESPAKAKTINKYLGKDYKVLASFGHIRELPRKNGSVDPENDFSMDYNLIKRSQKHIKELVDSAKGCNTIILASDPDREGEAIAWHVVEVLKQKKAIKKDTKIERVVFNAITRETVTRAMGETRKLDMDLVNAQQARVALDYLVGFSLSPVLWRKLPGSKSAGRVQSVALRLICERQVEILNFKSEEYWSLDVLLKNGKNEDITARLVAADGKKLDRLSIGNEALAKKLKSELEKETYTVEKVETKEIKRNPFAPFTTSTLQQEASRKLGFSAKKTMTLAQKLYEGVDLGGGTRGLITYMRTDGVYTAPEAIVATRKLILEKYGQKYLPERAIIYKNKIKNAQEAHEAVRPTDPEVTPDSIRAYLSGDEYRLYELIWKRLVASQMANMILNQISIDIKTSNHLLRATGSNIKFDGFHILYSETEDDGTVEDLASILPSVSKGENLALKKVLDKQHFTEPPPRYTEASLVKKMEELGIGRPSTYANIIGVLQDREYVKLTKKRFEAENRGLAVNAFLKLYFRKYIEYDYTAKLENDLDVVSNGKKDWKELLREFWFPFKVEVDGALKLKSAEILEKMTEVLSDSIFESNDREGPGNKCPNCDGGTMGLRAGKFGMFLACSNYPQCKYTKQISSIASDEYEVGTAEGKKFENRLLGSDGDHNVYLKRGPYGFYIQLGEDSKTSKPRRVGIPKGTNENEIELEKALALLTLPRTLGVHPDDGQIVKANIGPYGPYVVWNKKFYSVKNNDILKIDLTQALAIINAPKTSRTPRKNKGAS